MLKNLLITAWRNLLKRKVYSLLNIAGLAIGLAACLLIIIFIRDEQSYDNYHENSQLIYRVVIDWYGREGSVITGFSTIAPRFETCLESDVPGIQTAARIMDAGQGMIALGERKFVEEDIYLADPDIFSVLTIPLLSGNPLNALAEPNNMVISVSMADKYFGEENPLGKEIIYDGETPMKVTGVMKDTPRNSHVHFNFLIPVESMKAKGGEWYKKHFETDTFTDNYTATYLMLEENADPAAVEAQFSVMLDNRIGGWNDKDGNFVSASSRIRLSMQPVTRIHLISHQMNEFEANGDIHQVHLFAFIAVFILVLACINFINLSTAGAAARAREVGLRKVVGAQKPLLILQFFSETLLICFTAFIIAMFLVEISLPFFNAFLQRELILPRYDPGLIFALAGLFGFVGIAAGIYPAVYLSGFKPASILRGEVTQGRKGAFARKTLVVFQFTVTVILVVGVTVISAQMRFIHETDLGFNQDNIILFSLTPELQQNWESAKADFEQTPGVLSVCKSKRVPTGMLGDAPGFQTEVYGRTVSGGFSFPHVRTGFDFLETYGIELAAGRDFSKEYLTDESEAYLINETGAARLGFKTPSDAVGAPFQAVGHGQGFIVGVVRDFHYESLRNSIIPIVIYPSREANTVSVLAEGGNLKTALEGMQNIWGTYNPGFPFEFGFLDERLTALYDNDLRLMKLVSVFSLLAVGIACLGLYGLSSFTVVRKRKEIGIRKTLGASVRQLVGLLTREFTQLVIIGSVIAVPLAYYAVKLWLDNFVYRIQINANYLISAVMIALAMALLAVSYQTIRAALTNPSEVIRDE